MMQLAAFDMLVNYTQIAVHRPDEPGFFQHWTQADVERGYIARDGHAVFGVEDHDGEAAIVVSLVEGASPPSSAMLVFDVAGDGVIITTPVGHDHEIAVPAGRYQLQFSVAYRQEEGIDVALTFWRVPA